MGEEKAQRETWRDPAWMAAGAPEPNLITRAELIERMAAYGLKKPVTETALRYWEYQGVLPRPVRQRHGDKTAALYPDWMPTVILALRYLEGRGLALEYMRPFLEVQARESSLREPTSPPISPPTPLRAGNARGLHPNERPPRAPAVTEYYPLAEHMFSNAQHEQFAYAVQMAFMFALADSGDYDADELYASIAEDREPNQPRFPVPLVRAEIVLTDASGQKTTIAVNLEEAFPEGVDAAIRANWSLEENLGHGFFSARGID